MLAPSPRPARCHPERPHYCKGWCQPCYVSHRRKQRRLAGRSTQTATRARCHPERRHKAHGLCNACYYRARRAGTLPGQARATCHPTRGDYSAGRCWPCETARAQQARRDRQLVRRQGQLPPIGSLSSATPGLDADGYGRCWRCRCRRSLKAGIPRLICKRCQREVLALHARRKAREGRTTIYLSELSDPGELLAGILSVKREAPPS